MKTHRYHLHLLCIFLLLLSTTRAQDDINEKAKPIVAEGKNLYRSEMASWYGTDIFLERYKQRENIGGYFSYPFGAHTRCVFFDKGEQPTVIGTMTFDSSFNLQAAQVDLEERAMNTLELDYWGLRKAALKQVNQDTFFKFYNNTNLNLIPMIDGGERKLYILTGPVKNGIIVFGNDYLLRYDQANVLISKKRLHNNILVTSMEDFQSRNQTPISGMHTHLPETGEFITPTDICTLMLYGKTMGWESYIVVSKDYMNIWNCKTQQLLVMTREAMEKINASNKEPK